MKPRDVVFAPEAEADLLWIYDTIAIAAQPCRARRARQNQRRYNQNDFGTLRES